MAKAIAIYCQCVNISYRHLSQNKGMGMDIIKLTQEEETDLEAFFLGIYIDMVLSGDITE